MKREEVSKKQIASRILGRRLARELTEVELVAVSGGTISMANGQTSDTCMY